MPETSQTAEAPIAAQRDASRLPHGDENLTPLAQLKRIQRVLFDMTQEAGIDKREAAQCACAWERLQARKAAMTMRPAPKPVDTIELRKAQAKAKAARSGPDVLDWRKARKPTASVQPEQPSSAVPTNDPGVS